jgi:hypothetical protein
MPKVNDGQIKVSEPWTLKTRNQGESTKTWIEENQGSNRPGTKNPGRASKSQVQEGAIVDVISRNKSDKDGVFGTEKSNLSQKAGRGRNPGDGGRTMDSFSQSTNIKLNRNATIASKEKVADASGQVSKGRTDQRSYPKKGSNAKGRNAG